VIRLGAGGPGAVGGRRDGPRGRATRWGAQLALDLLDGRESHVTRVRFVRARPLPFPPEPLRPAVIQLTRNRLAAADRRQVTGARRGRAMSQPAARIATRAHEH
jgi:hypothetical protein